MWADAVPGLTDEILDFTEGKRLIINGGNWSDPDDIELIKRVFELQEMEWVVNDPGRFKRSYKACERIENGKFDIAVSFILACSHEIYYMTKNAAKKAEIPFFVLNKALTPVALVNVFGEYLRGRNRTPARARQTA